MTNDEIKTHMDMLIEEKDRAIKSCKIDEISRADVIEAIASADITDGTVKVFSGREVIKLIQALPSVQPQSCGDAINRKQAIENLTFLINNFKNVQGDLGSAVNAARELIKNLPSVQPQRQNEWILITDRLPDEYATVLVCTDAEEVFIADYLGILGDGSLCFDDNNGSMWEGDEIAWMPLPSPITERGEVNETND